MTKYFVDSNGNYLGGFDGAMPPFGAIQVNSPPDHGLDKWSGTKWIPHSQSEQEKIMTEFSKQQISIDKLVDALWKKVMGNDSKHADEIQKIRDAAKSK